MSIYGGTYVAFIALEFSLYETILRQIETKCEGQSLAAYSVEHVKSIKLIYDAIREHAEIMVESMKADKAECADG